LPAYNSCPANADKDWLQTTGPATAHFYYPLDIRDVVNSELEQKLLRIRNRAVDINKFVA
jgi:hypothetical protein